MKTQYCAFNITKQSFINLGVTVAGTPFARLRGLLGKMRMRSDEAVWVVPSHGVHTIGLLFPIDVLYLDANQKVIYAIENLGRMRIPPVRWNCASVLQLPVRGIFDSGTQVGDQLMIGTPADLKRYWEEQRSNEAPRVVQVPAPRQTHVARGRLGRWVQQCFLGNSPETGSKDRARFIV